MVTQPAGSRLIPRVRRRSQYTLYGKILLALILLGSLMARSESHSAAAQAADPHSEAALSGTTAGSRLDAGDQYDVLRKRWKAMLTGGTALNAADLQIAARLADIGGQAQWLWGRMNGNPARTYLWSDAASATNPDHINSSYNRLKLMALGYATPGAVVYHNVGLLAAIIDGLDWLYANRYNENTAITGNWWYWRIGIPLALNDITVLLYDEFQARTDRDRIASYMRAVNHFSPVVPESGVGSVAANRVWTASIIAVRGAIVKDSAKLNYARDALRPVFDPVTSEDGFYPDGSFIQHLNFAYNGGYGIELLRNLADVMYLLDGSSWEVADTLKQRVFQWIPSAFEPLIYRGAMMDLARGRNIASAKIQDHNAGHKAMAAIMRLAQFAPASDAADFRSMVKYWIRSDSYLSFFDSQSIEMIGLAKQILADPAVPSRGELIMNKPYPSMARTVHLRPGFAFGVSMFSNRIANYEYNNGENARGWFTGYGMTYLYNNDLDQYSDGYWATVDKQRLAGTTVAVRSLGAGEGANQTSDSPWVGGVEIQGTYGVAGMELNDVYSSLIARKSWFMFDDEIVALGSGITGTDGRTINTIIENRKLDALGTNVLTVDGEIQSPIVGWSKTLPDVNWAHLDGTGGYYFPNGITLQGRRQARTDTWASVNTPYGTTVPVTRNFLTLWTDHGANPTNAAYAYALLPNMTAAQVRTYAAQPEFRVIANTPTVQAVQETTLGLFGANFWKDGTTTVGNFITSNKRASVMTHETASAIEVAVADPTQGNTGNIALELNRSADSVISRDPAIVVTQYAPTIKLSININSTRGRTLKIKLGLGTGTTPPPTPDPNAPIVADDFNRQVTNGWGEAPTGGTYQLTGTAANFDVTKTGGASMEVPNAGDSRSTKLSKVSARDVNSSFTLASNKRATGNGQYMYAVARAVAKGTEYLGRIRFGPDGGVYLQLFRNVGNITTALGKEARVPGILRQAGSIIHVRFQVAGANPTKLLIKAWSAGDPESVWLCGATDTTAGLQKAGPVGLRAALSSSSTNAPVMFQFDNWRVRKP